LFHKVTVRIFSTRTFPTVSIAIVSLFLCVQSVVGQTSCLSNDDVKKMLVQVNTSQNVSPNKKLREELLKRAEKDQERLRNTIGETKKSEDLLNRMRTNREKNTLSLCPIVKEYGWPTAAVVGKDGVAAVLLLLKNSSSLALQADLLPVIVAAVKKGEIPNAVFAGYFDRLRVGAGSKQLFGTQVTIAGGFLVLYPIETEKYVDARRRQYDLPPLADYLRVLERSYGMVLVKSPGSLTSSFPENLRSAIAQTAPASLLDGQAVDEGEVIRFDTNLVSLNVSVFNQTNKAPVGRLEQKDFTLTEDGHNETITFFGTTDVPFDLVLLIDLSGSTVNKRDLMRKATQRFIEAARPSDRVAIVTFSDDVQIVSPLTEDHAKLLEGIGKIEGNGSSNVWAALKFTLDKVVGPKTLDRRRAVVFITDGIDNSLAPTTMDVESPSISFADLLESVRESDTLIIPIYLEQSDSNVYLRTLENARKTLALLAEESGGLFYRARKIRDLNGVYDQVIEDLSQVYSLGYRPTNEKRDGSWRTVKIQIANRPELVTHARPGYYAK
jgi:VWFA-related protein